MCAYCLSTSLPLPTKICHLIGAFFGTTGSHVHGIPCAWESGRKRKTVAKLKPMAYVNPWIFWATKSLLKWVRPLEAVSVLLPASHPHSPAASSLRTGADIWLWFYFVIGFGFLNFVLLFGSSSHFCPDIACKIQRSFFFLTTGIQNVSSFWKGGKVVFNIKSICTVQDQMRIGKTFQLWHKTMRGPTKGEGPKCASATKSPVPSSQMLSLALN